jgi:hypothetical protein
MACLQSLSIAWKPFLKNNCAPGREYSVFQGTEGEIYGVIFSGDQSAVFLLIILWWWKAEVCQMLFQ